jgi:hypothetical protein
MKQREDKEEGYANPAIKLSQEPSAAFSFFRQSHQYPPLEFTKSLIPLYFLGFLDAQQHGMLFKTIYNSAFTHALIY